MVDPIREQRFLGRILPGMDVCDVGGDKIGSIAQVHRRSVPIDAFDVAVPDEIVEVKTGFLGLGKHLYIPMSDVHEVLPESVYLARAKEQLKSLGYYSRPDHIS